jgi:hypothetical protein
MSSKKEEQQERIKQEAKDLTDFFSLLYEVDKRVNPEHYEKSNRSTNTTDKA